MRKQTQKGLLEWYPKEVKACILHNCYALKFFEDGFVTSDVNAFYHHRLILEGKLQEKD